MPLFPKPDIKNLTPFQQGVIIILLVTVISLLCLLFGQKSMQAWNMIIAPLFLFCVYNPILGAFQQKLLHYTGASVLAFIIISIYIYISGNFVSEFSFKQSGELHLIFILAVLFFFLLNLLCLLFRGILYLLEQIDN